MSKKTFFSMSDNLKFQKEAHDEADCNCICHKDRDIVNSNKTSSSFFGVKKV